MTATTVIACLAAAGCCAWFVGAWFGLRTARAIPRLADMPRPPAPAARVPARISLIVPARNEAATLPNAAASWLADDDPQLEIVLVDDRSDDDTPALVDRLAAAEPRITAVHIESLPDGWMGKPHALHCGATRARGDWLLFTDADVHIEAGTMRRAVEIAEARGADHVVGFPDVGTQGLLLDSVVATFSRMLALGGRLWAVSDPASDAFAGVGAFNLVRRTALERTPGFEAIRFDVADDFALGRLLKRAGARPMLVSATGLVSVDWYHSFPELARGLEKNTFAVLECSLLRALCAVVVLLGVEAAPWVALAGDAGWLRVLGACTLLVGLATGWGMARWARRPLLPTLLSPLGTLLFAYVLLRGAIIGTWRGGIRWRGTFYPSEAVRRGLTVRRR